MKPLQKKWWLLNKTNNSVENCKPLLLAVFFLFSIISKGQQIANYISNGGFEIYNCGDNLLHNCKNWGGIDSLSCGGVVLSYCNGFAPSSSNTFQHPRTDSTFVGATFYWPSPGARCYLKNRMKSKLVAGETYCVKFHVNIANTSPWGIDGFGVFFGDNSLDTITQSNIPLSYITPQVSNPDGNVITDTLNWIPITGTFVANGNEKFAVIGNFKSDAAVNTASIGGPHFPLLVSDICLDDVSCIPIDLPAYAYNSSDAWILPGDSVYLGRERDVGIDEACMWYELPNSTTAIDTAAGIWVKPTQTTSYLVKQDICGNIKWALVTVNMSDVGIAYPELAEGYRFTIYPNPALNEVTIEFANEADFTKPKELKIIDVLGREAKTVLIESKTQKINIEDLSKGIYYLQLQLSNGVKITKKLVKE